MAAIHNYGEHQSSAGEQWHKVGGLASNKNTACSPHYIWIFSPKYTTSHNDGHFASELQLQVEF